MDQIFVWIPSCSQTSVRDAVTRFSSVTIFVTVLVSRQMESHPTIDVLELFLKLPPELQRIILNLTSLLEMQEEYRTTNLQELAKRVCEFGGPIEINHRRLVAFVRASTSLPTYLYVHFLFSLTLAYISHIHLLIGKDANQSIEVGVSSTLLH